MNRRDSLKLMVVGTTVAAWPALALERRAAPVLIYDGRFAPARAFAAGAARAFDCQFDAALLWYHSFAGEISGFTAIHGLTTQADAMVLADCARRSGLHFAQGQGHDPSSHLISWWISSESIA